MNLKTDEKKELFINLASDIYSRIVAERHMKCFDVSGPDNKHFKEYVDSVDRAALDQAIGAAGTFVAEIDVEDDYLPDY